MGAHPDRPTTTSWIRLWLGWWVALLAIYLLLVDTTDPEELLVGALAAALASTLAVAIHRRSGVSFRPRPAWFRQAPSVAWSVVVDCGLLAQALWRRVIGGELVEGVSIRVPFHYGSDDGRDVARRALVNFAVSLTPNSYVVDIDPEADSLLVHRLVAAPLDQVLRRQQEIARSAPDPGAEGGPVR